MEIKRWHKVLFFTSIGIFIAYLQRERILKSAKYIRSRFAKFVSMFASRWVGVQEIGNNQGFGNSVFQDMMKRVGWSTTESWCMYFAKAVHLEAFKDNPTEQAKIKKILTGNTQQSFVNAKNDKSGTYTVSNTPEKGDIIIFQHSSSPYQGHAGIVTKVNTNNTVDTVEGNTSEKSINNGDVVGQKNRTSVVGQSIGGDLVVRGFIRKLIQ